MGTHDVPYGIAQCYLPPGRMTFPTQPVEAVTWFIDPRGMQGWVGYILVNIRCYSKSGKCTSSVVCYIVGRMTLLMRPLLEGWMLIDVFFFTIFNEPSQNEQCGCIDSWAVYECDSDVAHVAHHIQVKLSTLIQCSVIFNLHVFKMHRWLHVVW